MIPELLLVGTFALGFSSIPVPSSMQSVSIKEKSEYISINKISQTTCMTSYTVTANKENSEGFAIKPMGTVKLSINPRKKRTIEWF